MLDLQPGIRDRLRELVCMACAAPRGINRRYRRVNVDQWHVHARDLCGGETDSRLHAATRMTGDALDLGMGAPGGRRGELTCEMTALAARLKGGGGADSHNEERDSTSHNG